MKKNPKIISIILSITSLITLSIAACKSTASDGFSDTDCIPPLFDLAYPFDANASYDPTPVPLPQRWKPLFEETPFDYIHWLAIRNDDEVWFIGSDYSYHLVRYTPSTGEFKEYTVKDESGNDFRANYLFMSEEGTLWAWVDFSNELAEESRVHLSRYDDETDRFEVIRDKDGILSEKFPHYSLSSIVEDQEGILWVVYGEALTRFDTATLQAKRVLGEENGYRLARSIAMSIAPDGAIWVNVIKEGCNSIVRYDPQTEDVRDFGSPPDCDRDWRIYDLFFDHTGRLWVGGNWWLDISEDGSVTWYKLIPSPIFISDKPWDVYQYGWFLPPPELETMDRYIWFSSEDGLARLDLKTNQWCLISTLSISSITEDSNHNLWVVSDGQIYKYEYEP